MEIKTHPIYDLYEANNLGEIRKKKIGLTDDQGWRKGNRNITGYLIVSVRGKDEDPHTCTSHRFVYECFNGIITNKELQTDHIDDDKTNNNINNLQLLTRSGNNKKSMINRKEILEQIQKNAHAQKRQIKGYNLETKETHFFKSKNQASKFYGCSPALVYLICEGKNKAQTFEKRITFKYDDNEREITIIKDPRIKERTKEYLDLIKEKRNKYAREKYQKKKDNQQIQ